MKSGNLAAALLLGLVVLAGCATPPPPPPPPAADDWSTEFVGTGSVRTVVTNASGSALFLKIRAADATAAQVQMAENGSRTVFLRPGSYHTVMKLSAVDGPEYYRGPGFDVPPSAARANLTVQPSPTTNLTPIGRREFER